MTARGELSFCESVTASGTSPWHLRRLSSAGLKLTGGVDTPSLCGHVRPPYGWDVPVEITSKQLWHACKECVALASSKGGAK